MTKDLGPFYTHKIFYRLKPKGFIEKAFSQEVEGKYRKGFAVAVRIPFTQHGVVVGVWRKTGYNEYQALAAAMGARGLKANEEAWEAIRDGVTECSNEEEMLNL